MVFKIRCDIITFSPSLSFMQECEESIVRTTIIYTVCQRPQNFTSIFFNAPLNTVIIQSTPPNLFSLKLIFESWKSESQHDISITRISDTLSYCFLQTVQCAITEMFRKPANFVIELNIWVLSIIQPDLHNLVTSSDFQMW